MIEYNLNMIRPIRSDSEYEILLKEIEKLWDSPSDSPEGEKCEILCLIIEDYEKKSFAIDADYDPIDVINFWMEQNTLSRKDLEKFIGHRGRVAEVLGRKRPLSISMIRNLVAAGIPAELLVREINTGVVSRRKIPGAGQQIQR